MAKTERLKLKNILTPRMNDSYENEDDEDKKETYSSFIIKMLEKTKSNKNYQRNRKSINDSFSKKSNYNAFKTNYIIKQKNKSLSNCSKISNIKYPNKNNLSINIKQKQATKDNFNRNKLDSLNLNDTNKTNFKTFKINSYNNKKNNYIKNSPSKKEKNDKSIKLKNKNILNKLYGYNKKFIFSKSNILKNKNLIGLDIYQNKILKISQRKLSRDNLIRLYTELQTIKADAEMIKPLPPINYPALVIHSFREVEDKDRHKLTKSYENKKLKEMDDYEKELYNIKKSNGFKRVRFVKNKRLYKIFEILPEHVVDVVFKNKNKII